MSNPLLTTVISHVLTIHMYHLPTKIQPSAFTYLLTYIIITTYIPYLLHLPTHIGRTYLNSARGEEEEGLPDRLPRSGYQGGTLVTQLW
jgi:hypothetical protein